MSLGFHNVKYYDVCKINFLKDNFWFLALYIATDFGIHDIHAPRFETPFDAMFNMFTMSIGEFAPIYSAFTGIKYESLAQVKYILKNVEILLHI